MMLELQEDMEAASAKLAAEQAAQMLQEAVKASLERIDDENESMRNWEENFVRRSSYNVDGKTISKEAIVDSSLGKSYTETQTVHYYEDYYNAGPEQSVSLSKTMLEGLNSSAVMLLVEQANGEIESWSTSVFGETEEDDDGNFTLKQNYSARSAENDGRSAELEEYKALSKKDSWTLSEEEEERLGELSALFVSERDGELGEWIGYAPQFKNGKDNAGNEDKENEALNLDLSKGRDWNVKHYGRGEMGKIMLDFQWNSMVESQGWAKLALPAYDQPLWRAEEGAAFEAPTLRGVTSVVCDIVGTASGQTWFSYADDVIFAAIDLGGGFKSAEEVGLELAKTALSAAVSVGCSSLGSAVRIR